jgi:hypothetical protein
MCAVMDDQYMEMTRSAERALSKAWQYSVQLKHREVLDSSPRSHMSRVTVIRAPADAPSTLVLKRALERDGLVNEWAGLQFLSAVAGEGYVVPQFYTGDMDANLIVMADLGNGRGVDASLLGNNAERAEQALRAWARTLGRIHAASMPHYEQYQRIRATLEPVGTEQVRDHFRTIAVTFRQIFTDCDVAPTSGLEQDLATLTNALTEPGPFYAYTQGDPCPDNNILVNDTCVLFDFESGGFRHALTDAIYIRLGFPLCWCAARLPAQVSAAVEQAYRGELMHGCTAAANDDLFARALVEGCAVALVRLHQWESVATLLRQDSEHDYVTARQKFLLVLATFVQLTAMAGHVEALGETARHVLTKLQTHWPDAEPMPDYPAFQTMTE